MKDKSSIREASQDIPLGASCTWFVQRNEGILNFLKDMTADETSIVAAPVLARIGANTHRLTYAVSWSNGCHGFLYPQDIIDRIKELS
ncbi:hypothetical protein BH11ARM1_BH11ARM1_07100 [soil metagenome]